MYGDEDVFNKEWVVVFKVFSYFVKSVVYIFVGLHCATFLVVALWGGGGGGGFCKFRIEKRGENKCVRVSVRPLFCRVVGVVALCL